MQVELGDDSVSATHGPALLPERSPFTPSTLGHAGGFALALCEVMAAAVDAHAVPLHRGGAAVALLGEGGAVVVRSAVFESLVGDAISLAGGRLAATDRKSDERLQSALRLCELFDGDDGGPLPPVVLRRRRHGRPVLARCHAVAGAARDFLGAARTLLVLDDLSRLREEARPSVLAQAFGLTPAEARLASRIGAADSLREAAAAERISYEAARTRLKTVFGKTGTNSQTALALLVNRF